MMFYRCFVPFPNGSVIKEEGEDDEEEMEDEEEDDEGEEESKTNRSNPDVKGNVQPSIDVAVKPESSNRSKRPLEVGYSLLEGQDVTEDEPEAASSSCSSDLSFGASSSGKNHIRNQVRNDLLIQRLESM